MLFGIGGATLSCFKYVFYVKISFFKSLYNFLSELNNIFHLKVLIRFTFYVKLFDDRRKKRKSFKALTWKIVEQNIIFLFTIHFST